MSRNEVEDWLRYHYLVIRNNVGYISDLCAELNSTQPTKILTDEDKQLIANEYVNKTLKERWDCIYEILRRKSNLLKIPILIDIFEKTNNQNVLDAIAENESKLESSKNLIGYNRPSGSHRIASQNTQPNAQVPQTIQAQIQNPLPKTQPPIVIHKKKSKFDSSTINKDLLDQIQGSYPLAEGSKGYALIINNIIFDHYVNSPGDLNRTLGAMGDSVSLDWVLREKYGYLVQSYTNLNLKDMVKTIYNFKNMIGTEGKPHSIIVCIMSHGEKGDIVITTERKEQKFLIYHAIDEFNNENCPGLQDVPKIFLFQCCRGEGDGEAVQPKFQDDATPLPPDESRLKLRDMLPTWSDMLLCYATIGRCKSYRMDDGSLFIQTFCHILQEYSDILDIAKIMTLVALHVKEYNIPGKEFDKNKFGIDRDITVKQICTFENILFKKKFYFPKKLS